MKEMKLRGTVHLREDGLKEFHGVLVDGTPFSCQVEEHDVELNEEFGPRIAVPGWIFVIQEGQQGSRCAIKLPASSLRFGCQVTVNELSLMPRRAKIEQFGGKKLELGVAPATLSAQKIKGKRTSKKAKA